MENDKPKEQPTWNEAEWGRMEYQEFHECPNCGCPNRYTMEATRGEIPEERMKEKPPALVAFQYKYETALYRIRLDVVADSCCKCGMIYTIARSKVKQPLVGISGPNRSQRRHPDEGMPPFFGRG